MLDVDRLRSSLPQYGLGEPLHTYPTVGSTNDVAAELARQGAPHGALVTAEEQTAGRGRAGRFWSTPIGASLALSLLLRPGASSLESVGALGPLGALAVAEALEGLDLKAEIKWPNDVLLGGKKVAGVLAEATWDGDRLAYAILGIGVNVHAGVLEQADQFEFPATSVGAMTGARADRTQLLVEIVAGVGRWLPDLGSAKLRRAWEARLAYLGQQVLVDVGGSSSSGRLVGLERDGQLRLETAQGLERIPTGALRLRPVDTASE